LQFKNLKINNHDTFYVGSSLKSKKIILFFGRNNQEKKDPFNKLLNKLILQGYIVIFPTIYKVDITAYILKNQSHNIISWLDQIFGFNKLSRKLYLVRFIKLLILIFYPLRWDYFFIKFKKSKIFNLDSFVERLMKRFEKKSIYIIAHSAGGILASNIANKYNIKKIICFGYPFKHPDKDNEIYRTEHLKNIKIPFLIIQGIKDEYGGLEIQNQYKLSSSIEFKFINSDHDYNNLHVNDWLNVTKKVNSFLKKN
jgi:hypothetical protein